MQGFKLWFEKYVKEREIKDIVDKMNNMNKNS